MTNRFRVGVLTLALILFVIAVTEAYTIDTSYSTENRIYYLVDGDGLTLYCNDGDEPGESIFLDNDWPPFYTEEIEVPSDLNRFDFRTIRRDDGNFQTTYRDWPLYLHRNDSPGEISESQGMKVVKPSIEPCE